MKAILKMYFLREQFQKCFCFCFLFYFEEEFWKCIFGRMNFWNAFYFWRSILKMLFFEGEIFENILGWVILFITLNCQFAKLFITSKKILDFDTYRYKSRIIDWTGCKQPKNLGRGTSLGYLATLGKSCSPRKGWVGSHISTAQRGGRVPKVSSLTVFYKGGWIDKLDSWAAFIYSRIQFLLREFYQECRKVLLSFLGLESSISQNVRSFLRVGYFYSSSS